ncbi:TPA: ArsR family transcriptional regulator [Vibrio harveyi]|nr:ArsR family transcriptional regulator [Vibrio harveyi]
MKVSNPLTIVAIFAGVAEAFATGALVLLPIEIQQNFVYFVMLFPLVIVVTFFGILVTKPQVLYAPSDYSDEQNFIVANGIEKVLSAKTDEVVESIKRDAPGLDSSAIESLRHSLKSSFKSATEDSFEQMILDYLKEHPQNVYTATGIGHILSISFRVVADTLIKLESQGLVVRGIEKDTNITLWQIKI